MKRSTSFGTYSTTLQSGGNELTHVYQFFRFSITYRTPPLNLPIYTKYQFFLYQTITEQRDKGKTFDQIAEWLNKNGYLSVRGKKFKGNHVHSIFKKKSLKDEKLVKKYREVRSDFSLEVFDKTLVKLFENYN